MADKYFENSDVYVFKASIDLIAIFLLCSILKKECTKRESDKIIYLSQHMKSLPLLCIISGLAAALSDICAYIPWLCSICTPLVFIAVAFQMIFMGFFQLGRLYYCFATSQVYSNNGYSIYTFFIMYTIGGLASVYYLIVVWFDFIIECGYSEGIYYFSYLDIINIRQSTYIRVAISAVVYVMWDLTTLTLYVRKVKVFRSSTNITEKGVHSRITCILNRIIILTIFYEISTVVHTSLFVAFGAFGRIPVLFYLQFIGSNINYICLSYSICLMEEHNTKDYKRFIHTIYKYRIHVICCFCCRSLINNVVEHDLKEMETKIQENKQQDENASDLHVDTLYQTHDIRKSCKNYKC